MAEMIRIGNCSGFYGDRLDGAREMVDGGDIDVLTGDWITFDNASHGVVRGTREVSQIAAWGEGMMVAEPGDIVPARTFARLSAV